MKDIRRKLFYDTLVMLSDTQPDEWFDKVYLASVVNGEYNRQNGYIADPLYEINWSSTAHDVCSLMNTDRIKINESLAFEKIILVNDNKFKVANRDEALAEEKAITQKALKALWRVSLLRAKRLQDGQIIVDFEKETQKIIETFGGSHE